MHKRIALIISLCFVPGFVVWGSFALSRNLADNALLGNNQILATAAYSPSNSAPAPAPSEATGTARASIKETIRFVQINPEPQTPQDVSEAAQAAYATLNDLVSLELRLRSLLVSSQGYTNQVTYNFSPDQKIDNLNNITVTNGLTVASGGLTVSGNISGTWSGSVIGPQYGGTGLASASAGYVLIGDATSALQATSSLFVSETGNIGIGTTSPGQLLDLSYGHIRFTSVTPPTSLSISSITVGGSVNDGAHYYKVTFVTSAGETELGITSAVANAGAGNNTVNLSEIPIGTQSIVTARKIYRTKAGGSAYYLLATISNNTATTYIDTTADGSIGVSDATNRNNTTAGKFYINDTLGGFLGSPYLMANTSFGISALQSVTTGYHNTAMGEGALRDNTTGTHNNAFGTVALQNTTSGTDLNAFGESALFYNTTGYNNVAMGTEASWKNTSGYDNTALGFGALHENLIGHDNTAIGMDAIYNITGSYNTAVGYTSLFSNQTGERNVALGNGAGYYETGSNKLFIDNTTRSSEQDARSKALIYGIFNDSPASQILTFNANVGIGTTTPSDRLNILGTTNSNPGQIVFGDGGTNAPYMKMYKYTGNGSNYYQNTIINSGDSSGSISFQTGTSNGATIGDDTQTTRMIIKQDGNVGIGIIAPVSKLVIKGGNQLAASSSLSILDSVDNSLFFIQNNGNVGVGTTSPSSLLHVEKNQDALTRIRVDNLNTGTGAQAGLELNTDAGQYLLSAYGTNFTTAALQKKLYFSTAGITGGGMIFRSATDGSISLGSGMTAADIKDLVIKAGNVGIGTTSPYALLSISNSATTAANTPLFTIASTTAGTATSTLLTVLASGNVGIGTTAPGAKLDVNGNIIIPATSWLGPSQTAGIYFADGQVALGGQLPAADAVLGIYRNNNNLTSADIREGLYVDLYGHQSTTASFNSFANEVYNNYEAEVGVTNDNTISGYLGGVMVSAAHRGAVTGLYGIIINNRLRIGAGGTVGTMAGYESKVNAWGANTTAIGSYHNFIAQSPNLNGGTITDAYAFLAAAQKATGVTRGWGIYQEGADDINYFAGKIAIGAVAGTSFIPTNDVSFSNAAARKIWIENSASTLSGNNLTLAAGSTVAGSYNLTGGNLILQSGLGTGSGVSTISFQTGTTLESDTTRQTMSTKMTILGSGNIGIGKEDPDEKLHVYDNTGTTDIRIKLENAASSGSAGAYFLAKSTNSSYATFNAQGSSQGWSMGMAGGNNFKIRDITGTAYTPITIEPDSGDNLLYLKSGSVGIGTTSPYAILSISNSAGTAANTPLFAIASTTAGTATSTLFIVSSNGNVGIGTTTPSRILDISATKGNAIAAGWDVWSSESYKTAITYLSDQEYDDILTIISGINIATYYYKGEAQCAEENPPQPSLKGGSDSPPLEPVLNSIGEGVRGDLSCKKRLGLIAEQAPREVLSASGDSVSLYDLASYTLAGVKGLNVKVESLEARIAALEKLDTKSSLALLYEKEGNGSDIFSSLASLLSSIGSAIENGLLKFKSLTSRTIVIEKTADPQNDSIGEGLIKAGETETRIASSRVKNNSKIFVTFRNDYGSRWWIGEQGEGFFTVKVAEPLAVDANFDWWVVGIVEPFIESSGSGGYAPSSSPEPSPSATPSSEPTESTAPIESPIATESPAPTESPIPEPEEPPIPTETPATEL